MVWMRMTPTKLNIWLLGLQFVELLMRGIAILGDLCHWVQVLRFHKTLTILGLLVHWWCLKKWALSYYSSAVSACLLPNGLLWLSLTGTLWNCESQVHSSILYILSCSLCLNMAIEKQLRQLQSYLSNLHFSYLILLLLCIYMCV